MGKYIKEMIKKKGLKKIMEKQKVIKTRVLNTRKGIEYLEKIAEKHDIVKIKSIENGKLLEVTIQQ